AGLRTPRAAGDRLVVCLLPEVCEAQQEVGPRVVGIRGDELLEISHLLRWLAGRGGLERLDPQAPGVRRPALERHRAAQQLEERLWRRGVDREVVVSERE